MADIAKIKQLREETNVSYIMCQKALEEAGDDLVKARELLKKKGAEVAEKKADRATDQGSIFTYVHHNKKIGAIISLGCETDFVALNDQFQKVGADIAMHIASTSPESMESLMNEPFIKDPKMTIGGLIKDLILKLGENITLNEYQRFEI